MYIYFLVLICAVLPAYQIRFQISGLPITLLEVMILILFVVWLVEKIKNQKSKINPPAGGQNLKLNSWFWIIAIWLIVATISMFIAPNLREAAGIWKAYFVEPILLLIVFLDLIKTKKDLNLILNALIFSAFYCSVWAICQKIFHFGGMMSTEVWSAPKIWRATGLFPQSNFLGLYLGPIIVLTFGQIIANRKKYLWFIAYSLVFVLSLAAIILARSNGAILGVLVGLIFMGLIHKSSRKWTTIALIILLLIIKLLPVARNYVWQEATFQNLSGQLRVNIWQGAISLIKTNPILGVGLDGYQNLIPQYQARFYDPITHQLISVETHPYPHNLFLALWCELGLAGLIVFLIIIFQFFKFGFRELFRNLKLEIRNSDSGKDNQILILSLLASMVTILVHGAVDTPYFKNDLSILFWLIIGLNIIIDKSDKMRYNINMEDQKNNMDELFKDLVQKRKLTKIISSSSLNKKDKDFWIKLINHLDSEQTDIFINLIENNSDNIDLLNKNLKDKMEIISSKNFNLWENILKEEEEMIKKLI